MSCRAIASPIGTVIVCARGSQSIPRCMVRGCHKPQTRWCDFEVGPGAPCDRQLCDSCAVSVGEDRDYCPEHAKEDAPEGAHAAPKQPSGPVVLVEVDRHGTPTQAALCARLDAKLRAYPLGVRAGFLDALALVEAHLGAEGAAPLATEAQRRWGSLEPPAAVDYPAAVREGMACALAVLLAPSRPAKAAAVAAELRRKAVCQLWREAVRRYGDKEIRGALARRGCVSPEQPEVMGESPGESTRW